MSDDSPVLERVCEIVRTTFSLGPSVALGRATSSVDVDGWDSLSYSMLIMNVEEAFQIEMPVSQLYELADVGAMADLVRETLRATKGDGES